MKFDEIAKPGLIALGMAGMAATALAGFAAGMLVGRNPETAERMASQLARGTARGLTRAALLAAQAREHVADLWAEAREEALAEVDAEDFERAAASRPRNGRSTPAEPAAAGTSPRRRRNPRSKTAATKRATKPAADTSA